MQTVGDRSERKAMIETRHPKLSIRKQCKMLGVNRNRLTPKQPKTNREDLEVMKALDSIYTECPFYGQRKLRMELHDLGFKIGRKRVRRLMKIMGIEALVPKPSTSKPCKENHIYPYLLGNREIREVDEVWCADITYIPMPKGHAYLVAIMDWHSRAVLSWEVSNTMDTGFCVRALRKALVSTGRKPKIFNTDQGSQFSSAEWTDELKKEGVRISMDGKGRWMDNVFIERLWRSIKYEKLRLWSYHTVGDLRSLVADWMEFYNHRRKHQSLDYATPWSTYSPPKQMAA
ncbi:IS3 family transposase [Verrucomicrobiaceae bacterium N1E253]|uniref:IS3 family transposase n=1 Tax=Oceaniferula marina TaxID=2748318 RepID=A0A851GS14_9BACT|nr:IS3 family transposase [Oceaniferula marina]